MRRHYTFIAHVALTILLIGLFALAFSLEASGQSLTSSEHRFLDSLEANGIPTPDSISVVASKEGEPVHGQVDMFQYPDTVVLMSIRREHPNEDEKEQFPYLYGRNSASTSLPVEAHVLAHETAHILGPHLNAKMGRPALGLHTATDEVQAEILGLVLGRVAFGWAASQLGFPAKIDYPFINDKTTKQLRRQYCYIVKKTWSVQSMSCGYGR